MDWEDNIERLTRYFFLRRRNLRKKQMTRKSQWKKCGYVKETKTKTIREKLA